MNKKLLSVILIFALCICFASCGHKHSWTDATCTLPKTCSSCNETDGTAMGHIYKGGVCSACGAEDSILAEKYTRALDHIEKRDYPGALDLLLELNDFRDAQVLAGQFRYVPVKIVSVSDSEVSDTEIFYNEDNLPAKTVSASGVSEYTYDADKKLIREEHTWSSGDKSAYDYFYDENGNLVRETDSSFNGSQYMYEYAYNSAGKLTKEIFHWSDDEQSFYEYIYDENGKLIREADTSFDGTTSFYDYVYDENGKLIKKIYTYPPDIRDVDDYVYDENGRLTKRVHTWSDGGGFSFEYTYDTVGNIISKAYIADDSRDLYSYRYDSTGNLSAAMRMQGKTVAESSEVEYALVYIPFALTKEVESRLECSYYDPFLDIDF